MIPNTSVRENPKVLLMASFGGFPHSSFMYSRLDELVGDLAVRRLRGHNYRELFSRKINNDVLAFSEANRGSLAWALASKSRSDSTPTGPSSIIDSSSLPSSRLSQRTSLRQRSVCRSTKQSQAFQNSRRHRRHYSDDRQTLAHAILIRRCWSMIKY